MKKWMKIIGVLGIIGILALAYVWFFVYNKPHRDYENADPDQIVAAEQMFNQFRTNKAAADSLYTGSVVQISGPIKKVETNDSVVVAIFIFDQGMFGDEGIRCWMLPNQFVGLNEYKVNSIITLKGYCTGYNDTDIIIEKCSIVK